MQFSLSTLLSLTPLLLPTLASPITPTSSAATSQPTGAAFGQPFFLQAEVSNTTSFGGLLLLGSYTTPSGENIAALQNHTGIPINYVANVKFSGVSGSETESSIIAYAGDGTLALTLGQYDLVPLNWSAFPGSKGWFLDGQNLFRYEPIPTLQFLGKFHHAANFPVQKS